MFAYQGKLIVVMDSKLTKKTKAKVEARTETGRCLLCERTPWRRGLCTKHYGRFRTVLNAHATEEARAEYEATCIRQGMILEGRQGCKNVTNEFAAVAN